MSQIGGHLALFIGVSLLSVVQLVDFIITAFLQKCGFCKTATGTLNDNKKRDSLQFDHSESVTTNQSEIYDSNFFDESKICVA